MTLPCADRVVLPTVTMVREPEPLERVRALVCEFCWVNCFDTEAFENLGRGDIDEFTYDVSITRGHHAMICMLQSVRGSRLPQLPRIPNGHNVG